MVMVVVFDDVCVCVCVCVCARACVRVQLSLHKQRLWKRNWKLLTIAICVKMVLNDGPSVLTEYRILSNYGAKENNI